MPQRNDARSCCYDNNEQFATFIKIAVDKLVTIIACNHHLHAHIIDNNNMHSVSTVNLYGVDIKHADL